MDAIFLMIFHRYKHVGVSKNRGTPKRMVKIMENPIKMDDLGGKPTIFGNIHVCLRWFPTETVTVFVPGSQVWRAASFARPAETRSERW